MNLKQEMEKKAQRTRRNERITNLTILVGLIVAILLVAILGTGFVIAVVNIVEQFGS